MFKNIRHKIRKDGLFVGIDWFSTKHEDFKKGITIDRILKIILNHDNLKILVVFFFQSKSYKENIFKFHFSIETFEHKENKMLVGKNRINTSSINFVIRKIK